MATTVTDRFSGTTTETTTDRFAGTVTALIPATGRLDCYALLETGNYALLETGFFALLETSGVVSADVTDRFDGVLS